jgi:hypothetical protein
MRGVPVMSRYGDVRGHLHLASVGFSSFAINQNQISNTIIRLDAGLSGVTGTATDRKLSLVLSGISGIRLDARL